jgi:hypothetical protein
MLLCSTHLQRLHELLLAELQRAGRFQVHLLALQHLQANRRRSSMGVSGDRMEVGVTQEGTGHKRQACYTMGNVPGHSLLCSMASRPARTPAAAYLDELELLLEGSDELATLALQLTVLRQQPARVSGGAALGLALLPRGR